MIMSDKQLWQQVYLAAIQAGKEAWVARDAADVAIKNQPKV